MGQCASTNAATYPGNNRSTKPSYQPSADEYKQVNSTTAVADAHFVACAGGNALKLVGKPNRAEDSGSGGFAWAGDGPPQYISVTLPPGVEAGDTIHVRAPDGRMNAISVPAGMGPGSTFTVEFAPDTPPPAKQEDFTPGVYVPTVEAELETGYSTPGVYVPTVEAELETGFPESSGGYNDNGYDGMETMAKPTTVPYNPAYAPTY